MPFVFKNVYVLLEIDISLHFKLRLLCEITLRNPFLTNKSTTVYISHNNLIMNIFPMVEGIKFKFFLFFFTCFGNQDFTMGVINGAEEAIPSGTLAFIPIVLSTWGFYFCMLSVFVLFCFSVASFWLVEHLWSLIF